MAVDTPLPWERPADLDADEVVDLRRRGRQRRWPAGAVVFTEGDDCRDVYLVEQGHLKVSRWADGAHEVVLAVFGPGELVGELSALDRQRRSGTLSTVEPAVTTHVSAAEFEAFLIAHPTMTVRLLQIVARRLRDADLRGVEYATVDLPGRLAARLVDLAVRGAADSGRSVELAVSHEELAGWTAASREAVSKTLAEFRRFGWIRTGRRQIVIVDLRALRQRSQRPSWL